IGKEAIGQGGVAGLEARIDATFGNPIYFAIYMLFHVFIAAYLWAQLLQSERRQKWLWPSIFYGITILFDTMSVLFSGTRGTILGWGQENYAIVFDKYYDPRMYGQEPWFDRVHNIIFDWLVAGGFPGLILYLLIFAALLRVLWKADVFTLSERSILTGLLVGY